LESTEIKTPTDYVSQLKKVDSDKMIATISSVIGIYEVRARSNFVISRIPHF